MNVFAALRSLSRSMVDAARVHFHVAAVSLKHPTLTVQRPAVWRYDSLGAIELGRDVTVGPFTEVIVYRHTPRSAVEGAFACGDRVFIGAGCNIRAAGGRITIGSDTLIAQLVAIIAANHTVVAGRRVRETPLDPERTGVSIGRNCWIGAGSVILPGVRIGDDAVIGAGSVVTRDVPPGEIWLGTPARARGPVREA